MGDIDNALKQLAVDRDTNLEQYQSQLINTYQSLYNKIESENEFLKNNYSNDSSSALLQNSKYIDQSNNILHNIAYVMFFIYLILAIILSGLIIRKPYSIWFKIIIIIIIIGYPFYIFFIEKYLYICIVYIYSLLLSSVYNSGYGNTSVDYATTKLSINKDSRKVA